MRLKFLRDSGLQFGIIELTPPIAAEFIANMGTNRKQSEVNIKRYGEAFTDATVIYQPILFDITGRMIDGQNRCQAVIESGKSIKVAVIAGLPAEAVAGLDQGKSRTLADVLTYNGCHYSCAVASIICLVHQYEFKSFIGGWANPSRGRALEIFQAHRDGLIHAAEWAQARKDVGSVLSGSLAGFLYFHTSFYKTRLDDFWTRVGGIGVRNKRDPAAQLRNRVRPPGNARTTLRRDLKVALAVKAINAEMREEEVGLLQWRSDEVFPKLLAEYGKPMHGQTLAKLA